MRQENRERARAARMDPRSGPRIFEMPPERVSSKETLPNQFGADRRRQGASLRPASKPGPVAFNQGVHQLFRPVRGSRQEDPRREQEQLGARQRKRGGA